MALTLADIAKQNGWQTNYDNKTNKVSVINPGTGKSISFTNGTGQDYGMGGNQGGYNVVSDIQKLKQALSLSTMPFKNNTAPQTNTTPTQTYAPRQPFQNEVTASIVPKPDKVVGSTFVDGVNAVVNGTKQTGQTGSTVPTLNGSDSKGTIVNSVNTTNNNLGNNKLQDTQSYIDSQKALLNDTYSNQYNSQLTKLKQLIQTKKQELEGQQNFINNQATSDIQGLNNQMSAALPQYQQQRNSIDFQAAQNAKKIAELMAAQGLANSGDNISANVALNAQRGSDIANNLLSQQGYENDIAKRISDVNANKSAQNADLIAKLSLLAQQQPEQELALQQGIDADKARALQELMARADTRDFNLATLNNQTSQQQLSNIINGINAINGLDESAFNKSVAEAGLTGIYNGQQTLQGQQANLNKMATMAGLTGYTNLSPVNYSDPTVQALMSKYGNNYQQGINDLSAANPYDPNIAILNNLRNMKIVSNPALSKQYGGDLAAQGILPTLDYQKMNYDMSPDSPANKATTLENTLRALQIKALQDPTSPENRTKLAQAQQAEAQLRQILAIDPNLDNEKNKAAIAQIYASINNMNADNARQAEQWNIQKEQAKNTNGLKQADVDKAVNDYSDVIEKMYMRDEYKEITKGNPVKTGKRVVSVQGKKDIASYLKNLLSQGTPDVIVDRLASKYNVTAADLTN